MIQALLADAATYARVHPLLPLAFEYLSRFDASTALGRHDLQGDDLFALVQTYSPTPATSKQYESHRTYLDVQYVHTGRESIWVTPRHGLSTTIDYDASKDIMFHADPTADAAQTALTMTPGTWTLLHPFDAHKPGCTLPDLAPAPVLKVVLKLRA